jgi:hypothetical protein
MKDSENRRTVLKTIGALGVGVGVSSVVGGQIDEFAGVSSSVLVGETHEVALPTGEQMQVAQLTESAAATAARETVDHDAVDRLAGVDAVRWTDVVGAVVSVDDTVGLMLAAPLTDEVGTVAWAAFPGVDELDESVAAETLPDDVEFGLDAGTLIAQSTGQSYCEWRHEDAHQQADYRVRYNRAAGEDYTRDAIGSAVGGAAAGAAGGALTGPGAVAGAAAGYITGAIGGLVGGLITTDWCRVEERNGGSGGGDGGGGGGGGGGSGGGDDGGQDRPSSARSVQSPATGAGWL